MDLDHPLNCLTFNLARAGRVLSRAFEEVAGEAGLTAPQFATLVLLSERGPLAVGEIAEGLGADRTTLARNLDVMRRDGLIAGAPSPDRRLRPMAIAPEGQARLDAALPAWRAFQEAQVARLGEPAARRLLDVLQSL